MKNLCFYFQVHQPFRLRRYRFFDIGNDHYYYDDFANRTIMRQVADRCYLPMNRILRELFEKHGNKFRITLSISGCALEQFEMFAPDVLDSFIETVKYGNVELCAETYAHSLCSIKNKDEFFSQVNQHASRIEQLFGVKPVTFRNTELLYSDKIGDMAGEMGYNMVLTEGAKHVLGWKSPNFMYCNSVNPRVKVLTRNFRLSDDISFRFSNKAWDQWPLTAEKYLSWLKEIKTEQETVNIFMDYETFGEHQRKETGIFDFFKALPGRIIKDKQFRFATPSELSRDLEPVAAIHVPYPISWADEERDLTAWLGNDLQEDSFNALYSLSETVKNISDPQIRRDWLYLQNSDHFYYMCTKWFSDGEVHKYFNPYESPYDAYINYMNVLSDFIIRVNNITGIKHDLTVRETEATSLSQMADKIRTAEKEIPKTKKKKEKEKKQKSKSGKKPKSKKKNVKTEDAKKSKSGAKKIVNKKVDEKISDTENKSKPVVTLKNKSEAKVISKIKQGSKTILKPKPAVKAGTKQRSAPEKTVRPKTKPKAKTELKVISKPKKEPKTKKQIITLKPNVMKKVVKKAVKKAAPKKKVVKKAVAKKAAPKKKVVKKAAPKKKVVKKAVAKKK